MGDGERKQSRRQFLATTASVATVSSAGCLHAPTQCSARQGVPCTSNLSGTALFSVTGPLGLEGAELRRTSDGLHLVVIEDGEIHQLAFPDGPPIYFDWDWRSNRLITAGDGSLYVYRQPWNEPEQITDGINDTVPWFRDSGPIFRRNETAFRITNLNEFLQSSTTGNDTVATEKIPSHESQVRDHPWMSASMWQAIQSGEVFINQVIDGYRVVAYPDPSHALDGAPCLSYSGIVPHLNLHIYKKGSSNALFNLHFGGYFDGDELRLVAWESKYSGLCKTIGIGRADFAKIARFVTAQLRNLRHLAKVGQIGNASKIYLSITTVGVQTLTMYVLLTWAIPLVPPPP